MVNSEDRKPAGDVDPSDRISDAEDSSGGGKANRSVTRRLAEIFVEDGDEDLLLQRSDREDGVLQWLRALDMQVMGACRADERLKPLLKLNTSADAAEDPLLAHLSQHFEPAEVTMLARCLCIPLVSIRVGKIDRQGTLFYPTSIRSLHLDFVARRWHIERPGRGNLCLTLLPTSDLRISFNGDDGCIEKLMTLATEAQCSDIEIEDIPADKSGRSFCIKTSDVVVSNFWCSEKSKLLGTELRRKMMDLLTKKPSLADLTGISDSRLNCFATHFRTSLTGAVISTTKASDDLPTTTVVDSIVPSEIDFPRPEPGSNFLEESPRKSVAREKLRSISENYDASVTDSFDPSSEEDKHQEANATHSVALLNFLDIAATELPREIPVPSPGPSSCTFTPQYCWCPPVATPMQSTIGKPHLLPVSSTELSLSLSSLPPLSVLLADIPPIDFTALPTEPLVRHIPTFTPLICDPIAHVPVINVCSSGQGYLVSGGHGGGVVEPLLPKTGESLVEKSARETLRMLISSQSKEESISGVDVGMSSMEVVLSLPDVKQRCVWRENLKDLKEEELE